MAAPLPADEVARIAELQRYEVLDTLAEASFDRITRLAARLFEVPIAVVSLVDRERQWFKSEQGLGVAQTPRDIAFCAHTILGDEVMVVDDAEADARFATNPLVVADPKIRFYAGAPLTTSRGFRLGTLCLIDRQPRALSAAQRQVLEDLAGITMRELELRRERLVAERDAKQVRELVAALPVPVLVATQGEVRFVNAAFVELTGRMPNALRGTRLSTVLADAAALDGPCQVLHAGGQALTVTAHASPLTWEGEPSTLVTLSLR